MSSSTSEHSRFIGTWRGIAVALVVYFHYSTRLPLSAYGSPAAPTFSCDIGKLGVYIFFIISGYLIAKSMESCNSLAAFYAKRVSRIWPLFIFASILVFAFVQLFPPPVVHGAKGFYENFPETTDLIATLFFLNDLGFIFPDGAFWSIIVELKFYAMVGLFAVVFGQHYVRAFCIFAVLVAGADFLILAAAADTISFAAAGPLRTVSRLLHGIAISQYLPLFAIGLALYKRQFDGLLIVLGVLAAISSTIAVGEDGRFLADENIRFLLLMTAILAVDHIVFRNAIFDWIGYYSYAIYLFHQVIGLTIMKAVVPLVGMDLGIAIALAGVTLLAVSSSWLIEWRLRWPTYAFLLSVMSLFKLDRLPVSQKAGAGRPGRIADPAPGASPQPVAIPAQ